MNYKEYYKKKEKYMGYARPTYIVDAIIYDLTYLHSRIHQKPQYSEEYLNLQI